jgi:hypothetical protein
MFRLPVPAATAWTGFSLHVAAALLVWRRPAGIAPIVWVNLITSLTVLAWWATRWYATLTRGTGWVLSDQATPLYAFVICMLCGMTAAGRSPGAAVHWSVFVLHAIVLLAAALFLTFVRLGRLF